MPELPPQPVSDLIAPVVARVSPLAAALAARLAALAAVDGARRRYVVGVSGGVDSLLLLDVLQELSTPPLLAVHVHHGLSPHADDWAAQVESYCRQRQLECRVLRVEVDRKSPSREAAARAARHAAFESVLAAGDALLLAHHADDQAETLLLRLLRGSGLSGLGAMRMSRPLASRPGCMLWRPLLSMRRLELETAARTRGLSWVDDESNADLGHDRNFLRHEILPRLAARWPAVAAVLARTAQRLASTETLLDEYLDADLASRLRPGNPDTGGRAQLDAASLSGLSPARQTALLRRWLGHIGAPLFNGAWLEELMKLAVARVDAEGELRVGGWELHRYQGLLVAFPVLPPANPARVLGWYGQGELALAPGRLFATPPGDGGLALALPAGARLEVRFRQGGEQLTLGGGHRPLEGAPGGGHRPLKKALQDAGLPPWLRARVPLLYVNDELAAVGDRLADARFVPGPGRPATLRLAWQPGVP